MTKKKEITNHLNRKVLILAGHSFLGLGVLGVFLPILPTTIFLILAASCYAKSSPKMYKWLLTNKYFGAHLKNYKEKKGTPLSIKITSLLLLWISIGYTIFFVNSSFLVNTLLLLVGIGVTIHLITIKTFQKDKELGNTESNCVIKKF